MTLVDPATVPVDGLAGRLPQLSLASATASRIAFDPRFAACLAHWLSDAAAAVVRGHTVATPARGLRLTLQSLVGELDVVVDADGRAELSFIERLLHDASQRALALDLANVLLAQALAEREAQSLDLRIQRLDALRDHPVSAQAVQHTPQLRLGGLSARLLGMDAEFGLFALEEMRSRSSGPLPALARLGLAAVVELLRRAFPAQVLSRLRPGDVVLAGALPLPAWWRVGAGHGLRAAATVTLADGRVTLNASPEPHQDTAPMSHPDAQAAPAAGEIDVPVHFEIDCASISLNDLAHLAPGHVVALNSPLAQATVQLRCQGQTIGRGQLIAVGDQLGVRIAHMMWGGHATAEH